MATLVELGPGPVNEAERDVVRRLVEQLPHYYRVFPNITFRDRRNGHSYEYDVVLLTGHAVYVIEIKGWRGPIRAVNRNQWQLANGRFTRNPLPLNEQKARVLKSVIEPVKLVRQGQTMRPPYVQSVLVATDDAHFDVFPEDADYCLRPHELIAYVNDPTRLNFHMERDRYQGGMRKLAQAVSGSLEARKLKPRRFGSYVVSSTAEQTDDEATYVAKHAEFDDGRRYRVRTYAVSPYRFDADERARRLSVLKRSAEALHRVGDHPNVLTLREYGDTDDGFYEVTDTSDAGTLATALSLGALAELPAERRLAMFVGIARGLSAAHSHGVHHRELRPDVVSLGPDGLPRIGGFDVAFIEDAAETVYGKAGLVDLDDHPYRAPELRDPRNYDVFDNTDLYALGRIGYDLFLGYQPEAGDAPELPSDLPFAGPLGALLVRMTAAESDARPANIAEVLTDLDALTQAPASPAPAEKSVYAPEDTIAEHRVLEVLSRSDSAQVYRVENPVMREELALKLAAPGSDLDGPLNEYRCLGRVRHPNVVTARWAGRLPAVEGSDVGRGYLLLEYLGKETLAGRLERGAMAPAAALALFETLAGALAAVHEAGLVHRDVKPANIHMSGHGPVLGDFGSACAIDDAGDAPLGSPRYQPPDLADGGWDPSADVFALGSVVLECLTGRRAFGAAGPSLEGAAEPIPGEPPWTDPLRAVLESALSVRRAERFPDGHSLQQAIARARRPPSVAPAAAAEPRPATEYRRAADEALVPWCAAWVGRLADAESESRFLFDALFDSIESADDTQGFVEREADAAALEAPLPAVFGSLYDTLLTPSSPLLPETLSDEAEPIALGAEEALVLIEGVTLWEWDRLLAGLAGRDVERGVWRSGAVDPGSAPSRLASLPVCVKGPPEPSPTTDAASVQAALSSGSRCVRISLPAGRRDDELEALLAARREWIDAALKGVGARAALFTTTLTGVYLGHGLRQDVGGSAGGRGDRVRQAWQSAFGARRFASAPPKRESTWGDRWRTSGDRTFVVGRAAWPEGPDAPRIAAGGASLVERLLPLLRVAAR